MCVSVWIYEVKYYKIDSPSTVLIFSIEQNMQMNKNLEVIKVRPSFTTLHWSGACWRTTETIKNFKRPSQMCKDSTQFFPSILTQVIIKVGVAGLAGFDLKHSCVKG